MKGKKDLALDYGKKRIGIAGGDTEVCLASPRGIIENKGSDFVIGELRKMCDEWEVGLIVIGLPLDMDGDSDNHMMTAVKAFVVELKENLDVDVRLFDERLSTFEAKELMQSMEESGGLVEKSHKDSLAAQIILQRFFDSDEIIEYNL